MNVLLISANEVTTPYPVYPLGLDHVAAAIRDEHTVKIVDVNDPGDPGGLEGVIRHFEPDIIGVSLRNVDNTDLSDPKGFMDRYKAIVAVVRGCSGAPLVLGGSGFTMFPARFMDALGAEYGIIGEGERLRDLLRCLQSEEDPAGVPGVITPGAPERIPPPWDGRIQPDFPTDSPHARFYLERGGMLNLQTRRGCPFRCIYCTYPHIEGRRPRLIPPGRVAETALQLEAAGAKYLFITDSAFNADPTHSMEAARAFIDAGVSTPWGAFFAPMAPPDGYFSLLRDAGLTHVEFGTESLCDEMLISYGKPFRVEHVLQAHRAAVDARLHVAHYFLLGGPGESRETLRQTFLNVDKLDKSVLFFFRGLRIYPHTPLYERAAAEGRISSDRDLLEPVFYEPEAIGPREIADELETRAKGRVNWVTGSGGVNAASIVSRLHARGHHGPLWEYLIR